MIVTPADRFSLSREEFTAWGIPARMEDGLYLRCEVEHPPSAIGRNVTLHIRPEQADAILRALRDYGRDRRALGDGAYTSR